MQTSAKTATAGVAGARFITPSAEFSPLFNRSPFEFFHGLAQHPLFKIPRLLELAKATREKRPNDLYYDVGKDVRINSRWDQMGPKPPVEEAVRNIQQAGAWVTLHQAQKDPEYGAVFHQCMREFEALTGLNFKDQMQVEDALIFVTSPNRITPYHIDRECNFLLQISGHKTIYVFDQKDREVLPESEIERFWTVDNNAATYKSQYQDRAVSFRLVPGSGIHIPVNAPHWVKNDNNVSVSLSVNFTWKDSERANVYRANYWLRKMGLNPAPPAASKVRDALKTTTMAITFVPAVDLARKTVRLSRQLRGLPPRK
jgi:hypothetical protein